MGKMRMFLRKSSVGAEPLAVTMSGVRLGERALQIGLDKPEIAGAIAAKTGITGLSTIVVADPASADPARAADAGAVADVHVGALHALPFENGAYDVVVLHSAGGLLSSLGADVRGQLLAECRRVLRVGGRLLALESGAPSGLRGLLGGGARPDPQYEAAGGTPAALTAAGFRAVRTLGDRQGYRFIEGLNA